jgi:hypothetical protein
MSLQTTHNTATAMLHRELDTLRQEYQFTKIQLRELEMGNDDLERSERAVSSTLVDMETKYSRALEEKIILEQELLDKANVEEEVQRLKDELRGEYYLVNSQHSSNNPIRCQRGNCRTQRTLITATQLAYDFSCSVVFGRRPPKYTTSTRSSTFRSVSLLRRPPSYSKRPSKHRKAVYSTSRQTIQQVTFVDFYHHAASICHAYL